MNPQQLKAFIDAMSASDLDEMEVSHDGWTLRLVRRGAAAPAPRAEPRRAAAAPAPVEATETDDDVRAPMFGVVHLQQSPGDVPFVSIGDTVEAGRLLCTIEAMKVFNEVRAEHAGVVQAIHVASGREVDAGQPLMRIERSR